MIFRHRYDEVGLPWRKTTGSPLPVSTYDIEVLRSSSFLRGCGSAAEICFSLPLITEISCGQCNSGLAKRAGKGSLYHRLWFWVGLDLCVGSFRQKFFFCRELGSLDFERVRGGGGVLTVVHSVYLARRRRGRQAE